MLALGGLAGTWAPPVEAKTPAATVDLDATTKRLAIYVEGRSAPLLSDQIASVVPEGVETVTGPEVGKAFRAAGLPATLGLSLQNKAARKTLLKGLQKGLMNLGADAVLVAREGAVGRKRELFVFYLLRGDGLPDLEDKIDLGNGDAAQRKAIRKALKEPLDALAPPPPQKEELKSLDEGETAPSEAASSPVARRANTPGYELLAARVGFLVGGRWFQYSDAVSKDNTRPYAVFGPPGFSVGIDVYPAATTSIPVLRDLGLTVDYAHHFALKSATPAAENVEPASFGGTWNRLDLALRYRLRIGNSAKPVVLGLYGGYGFENFTFDPTNAAAEAIRYEVPTVRYRHVRAGLDAWLPIGMFALAPRASFQKILGTTIGPDQVPGPGLDGFAPLPVDDTVYTRFRGASVLGVTTGLDAALVLPKGFDVRVGFDYARYFSAFEPELGDAFVAGGALDEFLELRAGAGYRF